VARASARLWAGSTTSGAELDGPGARRVDRRPPSVRGLALVAVVLVVGALLAVCCCVDGRSTPSADGGLLGGAAATTAVDRPMVAEAVPGSGLRPVRASIRFDRAEPTDPCTTHPSTMAGATAPLRGLLAGGGGAPFLAAGWPPAAPGSATNAGDVPPPPPELRPSPHQLCVLRT
jgi:hypothetical protein